MRDTTSEARSLQLAAYRAMSLILAKLEWARVGASERQRRDIAGVLEVSGDRLDLAYLHLWAKELGLEDDLREAMAAPPEHGQTR